jgi:hypothetical protein
VAIATTGAKVGILGWQRSRLDLKDGICGGILSRDGSAALAFSNKWALGRSARFCEHCRKQTHSSLRLVFARQLLQMGILVVGGIRSHVEVGVAMLVAWVMASVVIIAPASKDRRANSER